MDDTELMELAAKAAGYQIEWVGNAGCHYWCGDNVGDGEWCPLDDDGDVLRLAARLRISIDFNDCCAWYRGSFGLIQKFWGGAHDACYKRAVVRVAAEIGRGMP